jgi:hypothetical protein
MHQFETWEIPEEGLPSIHDFLKKDLHSLSSLENVELELWDPNVIIIPNDLKELRKVETMSYEQTKWKIFDVSQITGNVWVQLLDGNEIWLLILPNGAIIRLVDGKKMAPAVVFWKFVEQEFMNKKTMTIKTDGIMPFGWEWLTVDENVTITSSQENAYRDLIGYISG